VLFGEIEACLAQLRKRLKPALRERLHGIGIAAPLSLGGWQELLGLAPGLAARWAGIDIRERVMGMSELPVEFVKDTAAASVAELVAGRGRSMRSFLYVFIDTFIGGGLVIDSHLHSGLHGNAGAVGSLSLGPRGPAGAGAPSQLLSMASLFTLEAAYAAAGLDIAATGDARALAEPWRAHTQAWLREAGEATAMAVNSAACLLDLDGVIIDGAISRELLGALLAQVSDSLDRYNWEGVARPQVLAGTIGSDARAIGGALLPLYAHFAPDRDLFLKLEA
jgi:predicted NBD/HSP70 family sugar kinase